MSDAGEPDDDQPPIPVGAITNVATRRGIRRQKDSKRRRDREDIEFWRMNLGNEAGRRIVFEVLSAGDAFGERYAVSPDGSFDPFLSGRHAGEQRFAFRLFLTMLKFDPEGTLLMLRENDREIAGFQRLMRQ